MRDLGAPAHSAPAVRVACCACAVLARTCAERKARGARHCTTRLRVPGNSRCCFAPAAGTVPSALIEGVEQVCHTLPSQVTHTVACAVTCGLSQGISAEALFPRHRKARWSRSWSRSLPQTLEASHPVTSTHPGTATKDHTDQAQGHRAARELSGERSLASHPRTGQRPSGLSSPAGGRTDYSALMQHVPCHSGSRDAPSVWSFLGPHRVPPGQAFRRVCGVPSSALSGACSLLLWPQGEGRTPGWRPSTLSWVLRPAARSQDRRASQVQHRARGSPPLPANAGAPRLQNGNCGRYTCRPGQRVRLRQLLRARGPVLGARGSRAQAPASREPRSGDVRARTRCACVVPADVRGASGTHNMRYMDAVATELPGTIT